MPNNDTRLKPFLNGRYGLLYLQPRSSCRCARKISKNQQKYGPPVIHFSQLKIKKMESHTVPPRLPIYEHFNTLIISIEHYNMNWENKKVHIPSSREESCFHTNVSYI
jgi:hypothetical protein